MAKRKTIDVKGLVEYANKKLKDPELSTEHKRGVFVSLIAFFTKLTIIQDTVITITTIVITGMKLKSVHVSITTEVDYHGQTTIRSDSG